jgi:pimeloyl-ACP methyl ester carboxylesterase
VALVHGFMANKYMLAVLSRRLQAHGYSTTAWGYWNMGCSLLVHAERFARELELLDREPRIDTLHVVGHSMGCIISRAALDRYRPRKMGRFVMLAPPNRGSFVATATARTLGRFLTPVAELSTADNSLVNSLPTPQGIDIGVIAANVIAIIFLEGFAPVLPDDPEGYTLIDQLTGR